VGHTLVANRLLAGSACGRRQRGEPLNSVVSWQQMSAAVNWTGGASVGSLHASWPFARLSCTAKDLSISLFGAYHFSPEQVVRIEPYGSVPIISSGIRIIHTNPDCPDRVIFYCLVGQDRLLREINRVGFVPSASAMDLPERRGMPWRWTFLTACLLVWNALFFLDGSPWEHHTLGGGAIAAAALAFLTSLALMFSPWMQSLALKPDRSPEEVLPTVRFFTLMSGVMLFALAFGHVPS
jgi:hypothetical protein